MGYLAEDSWLPFAKQLDPDSKRYVDHDCGSGRTLIVATDDRGWSAYCFRCGDSGYKAYGLRPMAELSVLREADRSFTHGKVELPDDFTLDIPTKPMVWLSKACIWSTTARRYNFGWSERMQRVILPIYSKDRADLLGLQARAFDGRKPKYLNLAAVPKAAIVFRSHERYHRPNGLRVCCITEDIASAVRVGMYVPTFSTLGTSLSDEQAAQISQECDCAFIWYDSDTAGIHGRLKVQSKMRMLGIGCYSIETPLDPKLYPNRLLLEALNTGVIDGRYRPNYPQNYEGTRILRENVCKPPIGLFR